jgi:DNA-binding LacI/PurR family transcriptional regulator
MARTRHEIEDELRRRIREGVYLPGQRLPTHRSLQKDLGTSSATLQVAFDRLVEQGYIGSRSVQGTFVAHNLPHSSTIGLVFPNSSTGRNWNRLYATIHRVAEGWSEGTTRFRIYTITNEKQDSPEHSRLCSDLADGGLAGLIFVNSPFYLKGSPALTTTLPRVCINGNHTDELKEFGHSLVNVIVGGTFERILKKFRDAGGRRIAALVHQDGLQSFREEIQGQAQRAGFETREAWWVGLPIDAKGALCARGIAALLLDGDRRERPDCLIIADDNLVPHATAGVLDAGFQAGRDIFIAAHANHPAPTFSAVPCLRYGADLIAQIRTAINELSVLAAGGQPRLVEVPFDVREDRSGASVNPSQR